MKEKQNFEQKFKDKFVQEKQWKIFDKRAKKTYREKGRIFSLRAKKNFSEKSKGKPLQKSKEKLLRRLLEI